MKKPILITLAVIASIVILWFLFFGGVYNQLVAKDEAVKGAWAQVENVYQRRADLIPNLVETVKGYARQEQETLLKVVEARSKVSQVTASKDLVDDPESFARFQEAQGNLSSALSRLLVVVEKYPDLKSNQNFLALQSQLEGTENRISVERMRFNEASRAFNTFRRSFPNIIIANWAGFQEKVYFKSDAGAEKAVKVSF